MVDSFIGSKLKNNFKVRGSELMRLEMWMSHNFKSHYSNLQSGEMYGLIRYGSPVTSLTKYIFSTNKSYVAFNDVNDVRSLEINKLME